MKLKKSTTQIYIADNELGMIPKNCPVWLSDKNSEWGIVTEKKGFHTITFLPQGTSIISFGRIDMAKEFFKIFISGDLPEINYTGDVRTRKETSILRDVFPRMFKFVYDDKMDDLKHYIDDLCYQYSVSRHHHNVGKFDFSPRDYIYWYVENGEIVKGGTGNYEECKKSFDSFNVNPDYPACWIVRQGDLFPKQCDFKGSNGYSLEWLVGKVLG